MSQMPRPRVRVRPIAGSYASHNERIVEFNNGGPTMDAYKGGLISIRSLNDGTLLVDVGNCDPGVLVLGPRRAPIDQDLPIGWENQ